MSIQLKTLDLKPRRQTFSHIARRFGEDRPASRYEEATYDVQARVNFHYRPLWAPQFEIHDVNRTAVKMADWYIFKDPRQLYYATYNISRSAMHQALDASFAMVEERGLLGGVDAGWLGKFTGYLIPLRHYEWGANMNNCLVADYGYGTQITSAAAFCAGDRLGMAQIIGRIGLLMDHNTGSSLEVGRRAWMEADPWQRTRNMVEDSLALEDWFETFVAQNLAMDGIVHPLLFGEFDAEGQRHSGIPISMLTEFMREWFTDNSRWVDAVVKAAAAESADNKALLNGWYAKWARRATDALTPLARDVLGAGGSDALKRVGASLAARASKLGLNV